MRKRVPWERALALLLTFCLACPSVAPRAHAGNSKEFWQQKEAEWAAKGDPVSVTPEGTGEKSLAGAVKTLNEEGGGTIQLAAGIYTLSAPLEITSSIKIVGQGEGNDNFKIIADKGTPEAWTTGSKEEGSNGLIHVRAGGVLKLDTVIVDADTQCRVILADGGLNNQGECTSLSLQNSVIQNGQVTTSQAGAGVCLSGGKIDLVAGNGTEFKGNEAVSSSATSGGGLYVGANSFASLGDVTFAGNQAHSGGAIYTYHGAVVCGEETKFDDKQPNTASQRGGAIHSHGLVVLNGTTIEGHDSGQYGGAIYISANTTSTGEDVGRVVLLGAHITGNTCSNSGGGVYVADRAQLMVLGNTTITDNKAKVDGEAAEPVPNNVCVATSNSKLITAGALSCAEDDIGVSTSNPYVHKVLVYSLTEELLTAIKNTEYTEDRWSALALPESEYTMTDEDMAKFVYDSETFILERAAAPDSDNMWLAINPSVGGGSPQVIFDFNLPGKSAITYPSEETLGSIAVGNTIPLPEVPEKITAGSVEYTFLGWYSDAEGGTRYTDSITVEEGTRVYYAQWLVKPLEGGGLGVPGESGLQLVYFDQNYDGGGFTTAYTFGGQFTFTVYFQGPDGPTSKNVDVYVPFELPGDPEREGYTFTGWSEDPAGTSGVFHGGSWAPATAVTTLYATWRAKPYQLTWDANGGQGGTTTTQDYDTEILPPTTPPTRTGYTFTGWYMDKAATVQLSSGNLVRGAATYYAGWTPNLYNITWDTNYTGGSVTTIQQAYDAALQIPANPVRTGYAFVGWYTEPGTGVSGTNAKNYGTVRGDVTFYANWSQDVMDYTVTLEWADASDNDAVRPAEVTVALLRNALPTGQSYTLTAADADASGDVWAYTFTDLPKTDSTSREYTYSVAITSSVSEEYSYGIENKSASLGYILMTHSLITRDVNVYLTWADDGDRDGIRPSSVRVQLTAGGAAVEDGEAVTTLSGSGDVWTYTFENVQKYQGKHGVTSEILYGITVTEVNAGELREYTTTYSDYSATLTHDPATTTATVSVVWADSGNQDNKRPASMFVQLYADNVPVTEHYALLSDVNSWEYTWRDLYKYADGGRAVEYSAHVTSTLVDYTAATTGMTIEMTYVPSSTAISAYAVWQDEEDIDGLRPELLHVELVADGKPTGDTQTMAATNGWMVTWRNYPVYADGSRIEYTFQVVDIPAGYDVDYFGIYDTSGLSVTLTHERILAPVTVTLEWDDQDNIALSRPSGVRVMLYADGEPMPDKTAVLTAEEWSATFEDLPVYHDRGTEIEYSAYVVSDVGKYTAATSGVQIVMGYQVDTVDVPLTILWDDNDNAEGKRPEYVIVTLTQNGEETAYQGMATAATGWTATFEGMKAYSSATPGQKIRYGVVVTMPAGYTAAYAGSYCALTLAAPTTTTATPVLHWVDNNDQYGERPGKVMLALLANGEATGQTATVYAADEWICAPFTGLPQYSDTKEIVYSITVSGDLTAYDTLVSGLDVYLTHKAVTPVYTTEVTATVVWEDGHNADQSRPYSVEVTLYANDQVYGTYTMTAADEQGADYTWRHTFEDLPSMVDGAAVTYRAEASQPTGYELTTEHGTFSLAQIRDIPIQITWEDGQDNDGKRPTEVTLALYADGVKAERSITVTGERTADAWTGAFARLPVWSKTRTDQQTAYTWAMSATSAAELEQGGYTVDYKDYAAAEGGNETVYPMTLSRPLETKSETWSLTWADESNKDGSRPQSVALEIYADTGDGTETLVQSVELTGERAGETWSVTVDDLPAYQDRQPIQYSAQLEAIPDGYEVDGLTLSHTPVIRPSGGGSSGKSGGSTSNKTGGSTSSGGSSTTDTASPQKTVEVTPYMTGYVDGTFRPEGELARCEAVAIFARISEDYDDGKTYPTPDFADVPDNAWYSNYLGYCTQAGIFTGYVDGTFRPMDSITREEFSAVAARFLGLTPEGEPAFADVPATNWAAGYIAQLAGQGIVEGNETGLFDPAGSITRAATVRIINGVLERTTEGSTTLKYVNGKLERKLTPAAEQETLDAAIASSAWFTDVGADHWAYYEVAESALAHPHTVNKGAE